MASGDIKATSAIGEYRSPHMQPVPAYGTQQSIQTTTSSARSNRSIKYTGGMWVAVPKYNLPKVRLGQMTGKKHPFALDSLDLSPEADDLEQRLRDDLDDNSATSRPDLNSRGSTPLCMVQVVGVGLSQSQLPSLDPLKPNPSDDPTDSNRSRNPLSLSSDRSSVLRRLQLPRRQGDLWGNGAGGDYDLSKSKGFIFHAERYQLTQPPCIPADPRDLVQSQPEPHPQPLPGGDQEPNENLPPASQHSAPGLQTAPPSPAIIPAITRTPELFIGTNQERLQAEMDYMESMRTARRKREVVTHREPINLAMGGRQVMFFERMDIMGEIQKLKTISLPVRAKELFVGRGFRLPANHALNNPRKPRDSEDGKPCITGRRGSRFLADYAGLGQIPTTNRSAPDTSANTAEKDNLMMVGDSLSQSKNQGFKIHQGSRKPTHLLNFVKNDPSNT